MKKKAINWKDKRKKAILKLGIWLLFFLIMAILMFLVQLFGKSELKKTDRNQEEQKETIFLSLDAMWQQLIKGDYHYRYQIQEKDQQEKIIYDGEKKQNMETGYRESKLGIVKYKIIGEKTYQIILEEEEEIEDLFLDLEKKYLIPEKIYFLCLDPLLKKKTTLESQYLCQNEQEIIQIRTKQNEITNIEITTNHYIYQLMFQAS